MFNVSHSRRFFEKRSRLSTWGGNVGYKIVTYLNFARRYRCPRIVLVRHNRNAATVLCLWLCTSKEETILSRLNDRSYTGRTNAWHICLFVVCRYYYYFVNYCRSARDRALLTLVISLFREETFDKVCINCRPWCVVNFKLYYIPSITQSTLPPFISSRRVQPE